MPLTRIAVTMATMMIAGRLMSEPVRDEARRSPRRSDQGDSLQQSSGTSMPELGQDALEVARPAGGDGGAADRVFEDQVPADDPGEQLAQGRVGVGVGRAGHRHHRGELGVAERREDAGDAGDDVGEHQRRAGDVVGRRAGGDEDAGADDGADAEGGELDRAEHPAQPVLALHLLEQHLEGLSGKKSVCHGNRRPPGKMAVMSLQRGREPDAPARRQRK